MRKNAHLKYYSTFDRICQHISKLKSCFFTMCINGTAVYWFLWIGKLKCFVHYFSITLE